MTARSDWKQYWNEKNSSPTSDYEVDRGTRPRDTEIENLANKESLAFIDAKPSELVFDVGCGTGANILLLHPFVRRIIAMDYSQAAVARCQKRLALNKIDNVEIFQG